MTHQNETNNFTTTHTTDNCTNTENTSTETTSVETLGTTVTPEKPTEQTTDFSEKRKNIRTDIDVNVQCNINGQVFQGKSVNISRGGIQVYSDETVDQNTPIKVEFTLPYMSLPMNLDGNVVWTTSQSSASSSGFGVMFEWKYI
ncbi:MAG: PilZ domain-containing protein [Pseudomonadota bacterium]